MGKAEVANRPGMDVAIVQAVNDLLASVPDAGGDGSGFILDILNAETAADLVGESTASEADQIETMLGDDIRIDSLTKWASDFTDPNAVTDQFLICHGVNLTKNQDVVFAIGAQTPVVKLAKLWKLGVFPVVARFSRSEKPTAQGFYPMNCAVTQISESVTA